MSSVLGALREGEDQPLATQKRRQPGQYGGPRGALDKSYSPGLIQIELQMHMTF